MSLYVHPEPGPNGLELVFSYRPEIDFWMRPRVVPRPSTPDLSIPAGRSLHGIQYIEPNLTPWQQDEVNRRYTDFAFPEMIQRFNQLPRPSHAPLGNSRNEWHFELREGVVVGDNTAFLHFINMDSSMHFTFGGVLTTISKSEQAVELLYLFLRPFIGGFSWSSTLPQPQDFLTTPFAPSSWSTNDAELADCLEFVFRDVGLCPQLCQIGRTGPRFEGFRVHFWINYMTRRWDEIRRTGWQEIENETRRAKIVCANCGKSAVDKSWRYRVCRPCQEAATKDSNETKEWSTLPNPAYCSRSCQRAHFNQYHRKDCSSKTVDSQTRVLDFLADIPWTKEDDEFMKSIGLVLPRENEKPLRVRDVVRRLVLTGTDSPELLKKYVPKYSDSGRYPLTHEPSGALQRSARWYVLLNPPRGSNMYARHAQRDATCPPWNPRPPSSVEAEHIRFIKEIQTQIRNLHTHRHGTMNYGVANSLKDKTICEYLAWQVERRSVVRTMLYAALDSMDRGIAPGSGGHIELANVKGEDWWYELEKRYFEINSGENTENS